MLEYLVLEYNALQQEQITVPCVFCSAWSVVLSLGPCIRSQIQKSEALDNPQTH